MPVSTCCIPHHPLTHLAPWGVLCSVLWIPLHMLYPHHHLTYLAPWGGLCSVQWIPLHLLYTSPPPFLSSTLGWIMFSSVVTSPPVVSPPPPHLSSTLSWIIISAVDTSPPVVAPPPPPHVWSPWLIDLYILLAPLPPPPYGLGSLCSCPWFWIAKLGLRRTLFHPRPLFRSLYCTQTWKLRWKWALDSGGYTVQKLS